jgi:hypothetical protein
MLMAVGIIVFSRNHSFWFNLATLAICTYLEIFAYPSFAMVLMVVFAAKHATATWKLLLVVALTVAASYALAILTIFILNLFARGTHDLRIALQTCTPTSEVILTLWPQLWGGMPIPLRHPQRRS